MSPLNRLSLGVIAAMACIAIAWGAALGFRFPSAGDLSAQATIAVVFGAIAWFYTHRRPDPMIAGVSTVFVLYALGSTTFRMWVYLSPAAGLPMRDAELAALDAMLGFDWLAIVRFYEDKPWLIWFSTVLYTSSENVMLVTCAALLLTGRLHRVEQFIAASTLAGLVTLLIATGMPAVGRYSEFGPLAAEFPFVNYEGAKALIRTTLDLHSGAMRVFEVVETKGIITFPSFHTIFALLLIWAVRGIPLFFVPALLWNSGIIFTTFVDGGHYFVDLLGGAVVAYATVRFIDWYCARHAPSEVTAGNAADLPAPAAQAPGKPADGIVWIRARA